MALYRGLHHRVVLFGQLGPRGLSPPFRLLSSLEDFQLLPSLGISCPVRVPAVVVGRCLRFQFRVGRARVVAAVLSADPAVTSAEKLYLIGVAEGVRVFADEHEQAIGPVACIPLGRLAAVRGLLDVRVVPAPSRRPLKQGVDLPH